MAVLGATDLTGCNSIPDFIPSGTKMIFQQSTIAPTSWTKLTTHDNKALRVVTGTATPGGGPLAFTQVFASRTPAGTVSVSGGSVGNHTLLTPQIPSHTHPGGATSQGFRVDGVGPATSTPSYPAPQDPYVFGALTGPTGSDGQHNHPFTVGSASFSGTAQDFAVAYVDVIIAEKV